MASGSQSDRQASDARIELGEKGISILETLVGNPEGHETERNIVHLASEGCPR